MLRVVLIGGILGLVGAFGVARLISNQFFGVSPLDVPTLLAASIVLTSVACVAAYLPARHASRVDPMVALRCE